MSPSRAWLGARFDDPARHGGTSEVIGLLLAAGAGRRMGTPKALLRDDDGTSWLQRSVGVLRDGGCQRVYVVLGASAELALADAEAVADEVVIAADWGDGMSASLRAGLAQLLTQPDPQPGVVVHLVDLPDVTGAVVRRVLSEPVTTETLRRAAYDLQPGHPVVIGRQHWLPILESAQGDAGAKGYLRAHEVELIECGDLATGADVDALP